MDNKQYVKKREDVVAMLDEQIQRETTFLEGMMLMMIQEHLQKLKEVEARMRREVLRGESFGRHLGELLRLQEWATGTEALHLTLSAKDHAAIFKGEGLGFLAFIEDTLRERNSTFAEVGLPPLPPEVAKPVIEHLREALRGETCGDPACPVHSKDGAFALLKQRVDEAMKEVRMRRLLKETKAKAAELAKEEEKTDSVEPSEPEAEKAKAEKTERSPVTS